MDKQTIIEVIREELQGFSAKPEVQNAGTVIEAGDGIARMTGLSSCMAGEMLEFPDEIMGVALNIERETIGAVILGDSSGIKEGDIVKTTGRILSIPTGPELIGRVIDPLGNPIDGKGPISCKDFYPIEKIAPGVITRESVGMPLETGIKAIDAMIPIGRGQRELIIGDRGTGKTAIAVDAIINQKGKGVICIYVAIGQKESKVAKIAAKLEETGTMEHTIIIAAGASDPASLSFIAPYAGAAIGEYFMDKGKDALAVYDDLSKHAWAYREISLLLRRPPGREAYPGDIFYMHSRLLERAAKLNKEHGGGSVTALPIIETQSGDVSAYIPTNVISITDGQIYLEQDLFYRGVRPALNVGLSVSRVGSAAQAKAMKKIAGKLRLDLAQFRELEAFAQFATDLDKDTRLQIERGRRIVEILKQKQYEPMPMEHEVVALYAATQGYLDAVPIEKIKEWEEKLHDELRLKGKNILTRLRDKKELDDELEKELKLWLSERASSKAE